MENVLRKIRQDYINQNIWRSLVVIIDKLLARNTEMKEVYDELAEKLTARQQEHFWDGVLGASGFWNPDSSRSLREDQKRLIDLNGQIAAHAAKLADLMALREELAEKSGFNAYDDYHISAWISRATEQNHLYRMHVKRELEPLLTRFDYKYWPTPVELMRAVAEFASEAEISITNDWTEELLSSPKQSNADYLRVLLKAIEDYKDTTGPELYILPEGFRLSDKSLATLINCTLDLSSDEMVSPTYVKRARQNIRNRKETESEQ